MSNNSKISRDLNRIAYARQRRLKLKRDPAKIRSGILPVLSSGNSVKPLPDQS